MVNLVVTQSARHRLFGSKPPPRLQAACAKVGGVNNWKTILDVLTLPLPTGKSPHS